MLRFFQRVEPETGRLVHDFTDEQWETRFLGDLYHDVSEAARKKHALLQTPEFVESFILDRTLAPAIAEFGLVEFRMIDPACGSEHFSLGSFRRLLDRWLRKEPGTNVRELVQRSINSIHGVDVNPYARLKSILGELSITEAQAEKLALKEHSQLSPDLESCCLHLSANVSYQNAAEELSYLTGIEVSKSAQQRLVHRQNFSQPEVAEAVEEYECRWREHSSPNA